MGGSGTIGTVVTWCPRCGDVSLSTRQVRVVRREWDRALEHRFLCPFCRVEGAGPLTRDRATLLLGAGSAEESREAPVGPLTANDLVAFLGELRRPGSLEDAVIGLSG